jgi:hypothetical protein
VQGARLLRILRQHLARSALGFIRAALFHCGAGTLQCLRDPRR